MGLGNDTKKEEDGFLNAPRPKSIPCENAGTELARPTALASVGELNKLGSHGRGAASSREARIARLPCLTLLDHPEKLKNYPSPYRRRGGACVLTGGD
jgi:hypothetical protein